MTNCKTCEHHQYNEEGLIKCQYGHIIGIEQPKDCPSYEQI